MKKISIVIPVFNEENRIKKTLFKIIDFKKKNEKKNKIFIVIVDDGSTDRTVKIIKEIKKKNKDIKILIKKHTGYIDTLFYGLQKCKTEYIGNMEADNAIDVKNFRNFLKYIKKNDVVIANRINNNLLVNFRNKSFQRSLLSFFYFIIFKKLFNSKIVDAQAGFRLYRKNILKIIKEIKINHDGLKIAELILRIEKGGKKIKQISVKNNHDNDSRLVPKFRLYKPLPYIRVVCDAFINIIKLKNIINKV
jgi:glycosyltransferase involved in cell wall biosynthesis